LARILLGVSGGIAAYKAVELVRLATAAGHSVRVIQTPASLNFVGRATFEGVTGAPVLVDEFEPDPARGVFPGDPPPDQDTISHLGLVGRADVFVVAPASANTLAKLAGGLADNLLTSAALATAAPLVLAPAMNSRMYEHPATQANVELLRSRGARVVEPGSGRLASKGEWGVGRLAEPPEILAVVEAAIADAGSAAGPDRASTLASGGASTLSSGGDSTLASGGGSAATSPGEPAASAEDAGPARPARPYTPRSLDGLRVLVTAGGTREPIDAVRFIGNRSSGRMGLALAEEAVRRGADVTLIAANVTIRPPAGVEEVTVETTADLETAVRERFATADVLIMAAAPADFRPVAAAPGKIPREAAPHAGPAGGMALELEPTDDIVAAVAAGRRADQTVVGFAAEHGEDAIERGRAKLARKRLDAVVVNDISRADIGFDSRENEVTIVLAHAERRIGRRPKPEVAAAILDEVERFRTAAAAPTTVEREP
jgi:phosphopantothenoylcysteine decarboxylase / phosphopantothenate---cysteine ligase